jgi:hypothetical protein
MLGSISKILSQVMVFWNGQMERNLLENGEWANFKGLQH